MKKGFFGYGRCPHCDSFLKEKDLEKNICWNCNKALKDSIKKKKKIEESSNNNQNKIINYLNNLPSVSSGEQYSNFQEAKQELNKLYTHYSSIISSNYELNESINTLIYDSGINFLFPPDEVGIYAFGVEAFNEGLRTSTKSYFNLGLEVFNISLGLKEEYHQAYNRAADCLSKTGDYKKALIFYNKAIYLILTKDSTGYIPKDTYLGDNYFKMAICQKRLSNNKDIIIALIEEARLLIGEDYDEFSIWGFKDWDDVVKKLITN